MVNAVTNEHAACWTTPSFAVHQEEFQPATFDYSSFGDLAGYELGSASTFLGDENQMDFSGFQRPFSPRRSSVFFGEMGEFPLMSLESSSLTWGAPGGDQAGRSSVLPLVHDLHPSPPPSLSRARHRS